MAVAYIYVLIVMVDSKVDLIGVCFLKFHRLDEVYIVDGDVLVAILVQYTFITVILI